MPSYVPAAFVGIENGRLCEHPGFDTLGIARANVAERRPRAHGPGASPITRQLARNLFLSSNETIERKAQELLYAGQLERTFGKRQILALYLSRVYLDWGPYGLKATSPRYFDAPASRLTVRQAATLADMLKSPTDYNSVQQPERAAERTQLVLAAMVETGAITSAHLGKTLASPLPLHTAEPPLPAQHFKDWLDGQHRRIAPKPTQDRVVETTLDMAGRNGRPGGDHDGVSPELRPRR